MNPFERKTLTEQFMRAACNIHAGRNYEAENLMRQRISERCQETYKHVATACTDVQIMTAAAMLAAECIESGSRMCICGQQFYQHTQVSGHTATELE